MTHPNNAQLYRDTASYIRTHGWTQKKPTTPEGAVCSYWALVMTTGARKDVVPESITAEVDAFLQVYDPRYPRLRERQLGFGCPLVTIIMTWNDCDYRSRDEVIAMFDALADWVDAGKPPVLTADIELLEITELDAEPELVGT